MKLPQIRLALPAQGLSSDRGTSIPSTLQVPSYALQGQEVETGIPKVTCQRVAGLFRVEGPVPFATGGLLGSHGLRWNSHEVRGQV